MTRRTLYLIGCAAPPVLHLAEPIRGAQARGWDVCCILTPRAHRWASEEEGYLEKLRALTGRPVRHEYKLPGQPDEHPSPDALLVAPLTNNTLNKWAAGISDTLALGLITEGLGLGLPIVALPYLNAAQARHPAVRHSVDILRRERVTLLLSTGEAAGFTPHPPRQGDVDAFPWELALDALPA